MYGLHVKESSVLKNRSFENHAIALSPLLKGQRKADRKKEAVIQKISFENQTNLEKKNCDGSFVFRNTVRT